MRELLREQRKLLKEQKPCRHEKGPNNDDIQIKIGNSDIFVCHQCGTLVINNIDLGALVT